MFRTLAIVGFVGALTGCGDEAPKPPPNPNAPAYWTDWDTPAATIKTLARASKAKKKEDVAKCFAESAAGEFQKLRKLEIPDKEWPEVFLEFENLEVGTEHSESGKPNEMTVEVKITKEGKTKTEKMRLVKEGKEWKIQDF